MLFQVLMQNKWFVFVGAALQTYRVPGVEELQKRLYVTRFRRLETDIWRLNINSMKRWGDEKSKAIVLGTNPWDARMDPKYPPTVGPKLQKWYNDRPNDPVAQSIKKGCNPARPEVCYENPATGLFRHGWSNDGDEPVFGSQGQNVSDETKWNMFAKSVNGPTHSAGNRYTRLTYADGKLYYLNANTNQRATLRSTDVVSQRTSRPFVSA